MMPDCGAAGAVLKFICSVDSGDLDVAQQAAEKMSQWDLQTSSHSGSIDFALCQTLAQIIRHKPSSPQQVSAAQHMVDRPGSAGSRPARRLARRVKQHGKKVPTQPDESLAEPALQASASSLGAQQALQAQEKRLHAAAALFGSEGLQAVMPMIADLCVLHEYEHLLQLSCEMPGSSAPSSSPASSAALLTARFQTSGNSLGAVLVDCRDGWQDRRACTGMVGARVADVRPSLRLEQLHRLASSSQQSSTYRHVLLAAAESALCSGSFQLVQKLLSRAAALLPGLVGDRDLGLQCANLQLRLDALTGQANLESSAMQLFSRLQSGVRAVARPQENGVNA